MFNAIEDKATPERSSTLGAEFWSKVDQVAVRLSEFLGATSSANVTDTINDVDTPIRADILQRWGELAGDPGARLASWLKFGAPAGISMAMDELDTTFARGADAHQDISRQAIHPDSLHGWSPPASIVTNLECEAANKEIEQRLSSGHLVAFDSWEDVVSYLGAAPVVSEFFVIEKVKNGKTKYRLIFNARKSGVTKITRRSHVVELPRPTDAVFDCLELNKLLLPGEEIEFYVIDFSDAFWQIPSAWKERKFFVAFWQGKCLVFKRIAQGSRNGPSTWGASLLWWPDCRLECFRAQALQACHDIKAPQRVRKWRFTLTTRLWPSVGHSVAGNAWSVSSPWLGYHWASR